MDLSHPPQLNKLDRRAVDAPFAPPIQRGSMKPLPWTGLAAGFVQAIRAMRHRAPAPKDRANAPWARAAIVRRRMLLAFVGVSAAGASLLMLHAQAHASFSLPALLQALLFVLLCAWVAAGFFTALMGFVVRLRGDVHSLSAAAVAGKSIPAEAKTAVIMPICNEHVPTVFAGLRATCESLAAGGNAGNFDFFVLSDTADLATRVEEETACAALREVLGPGMRVYYRCRRRRSGRKAGNVADFCRRWGRGYRYMIVLDADSIMSGNSLRTLVCLMEAQPQAGIIQTAPRACGLDTPHARAQQFAGRVTGALFTAGMSYWQLGESHYWGHNAILRVAPFMQHCGLAKLPGRGGLSGEILSHDFVEAALMRRAGYQVWLVQDLEGSYEQSPPNLIEELGRDRRWCQGNLQNARLMFEPGLHAVHRAMLFTGAMAYLSAPLWMAYILLGAMAWLRSGASLAAPLAGSAWEMQLLWALVLGMLFLPRLLAVVAILLRGEAGKYAGPASLLASAALEAALSALQAPIRMVAHSGFVVAALTGIKLEWKSPPREATDLGWRDAAQRFGRVGLLSAALLMAVLAVDPAAVIWLLPVGLPLLLAVPLAVLSSMPRLGRRLREAGLLIIPEESAPPTSLRKASAYSQDMTLDRPQDRQEGSLLAA